MEKMNPYLKDVQNYIEKSVAPMPFTFSEVPVEVDFNSEVLLTYSEELFNNINMAVSLKGGNFMIEEEEFMKYINTIIKMRIDYVRGYRVMCGPTERFVVPAFLSLVLSNIGRARHLDYGIELVPKLVGDLKGQVFDKQADFMTVSNALRLLRGIGLEYAEGYSRDKEGSFDFMTMTLIDGIVRNISKEPHPVYALLSATLNVRGIESVLSPRITYGNVSHLANLVRGLATLKV